MISKASSRYIYQDIKHLEDIKTRSSIHKTYTYELLFGA